MTEKRRFQRVRFSAKCSLTHNNITYLGQMENITSNGALISFNDGVVIPKDERCKLNIYPEDHDAPLRLEIIVIHSNFTMLGIRFATDENAAAEALGDLMDHLTSTEDYPVNSPIKYCRDLEG